MKEFYEATFNSQSDSSQDSSQEKQSAAISSSPIYVSKHFLGNTTPLLASDKRTSSIVKLPKLATTPSKLNQSTKANNKKYLRFSLHQNIAVHVCPHVFTVTEGFN